MERAESLVVGVKPERQQSEVRRRQEFGWILTSSQNEAVMKDGETRREVRLIFTRTGSEERLAELKCLEKEWETLMKSVAFDERGRLVVDRRPVAEMPWGLIAAISIIVGGLCWAVLGELAAAIAALFAGLVATLVSQNRVEAAEAEYSRRVDAATVEFHKKQKDILFRARAIAKAPKV
ncbi:MAG: hypothetical protein MUE68_08660 [Bacteroidetes bacterium]|jgi:hypothetical protein|nr:hypothetical protein [Bacteroidota bacterium]